MTVEFKVGDKVRVVDQTFGWSNVSKGDKGTIQKINGCNFELNIPHYSKFTTWTCLEKDIELIEPKVKNKQRITVLEETVATLAQQVQDVQAKVDEMLQQSKPSVEKNAYGFEKPGEVTGEIGAERTHISTSTPNELRKLIIEKAKRFVEGCKNDRGYYAGLDRNFTPYVCSVEFVVNTKKRTVVALVKGFRSCKVYARGIAKCMPVDVFNEHIGKAIALGRALGLDVSEFTEAVQPNKPVIGQRVEVIDFMDEPTGIRFEVTRLHLGSPSCKGGHATRYKITNDTNAQY